MPQREGEPRRPDLSRRRVVQALGAMAAVASVQPAGAAVKGGGRYGLAYTSFAVRMRQGRDLIRGAAPGAPAFPAETFIDLCRRFGADGAQMDLTQLSSQEPAYLDAAIGAGLMPTLKRIRETGTVRTAHSVIPSFTNPNNLSIATGRALLRPGGELWVFDEPPPGTATGPISMRISALLSEAGFAIVDMVERGRTVGVLAAPPESVEKG